MVTIHGKNWGDVDDVELAQLPSEGEPIETKYNKCLVTQVELSPESNQYTGKIVCRLLT
jgi:hypothetical protein